MLNVTMNANFNGVSTIEDKVVAYFSSSYNGEKNLYVTLSVEDSAVYAANKELVDADLKSFTDKVLESIAELEA